MKRHEKENFNTKLNHITEDDLSSEIEENEDNFIFKMDDVDTPKPITCEAVQITPTSQQSGLPRVKTTDESLNELDTLPPTYSNPQTFFATGALTPEPIFTKGIFATLIDKFWPGLGESHSP